jgi:23S rRNA (cytosine1962-C5)-methyltransferase
VVTLKDFRDRPLGSAIYNPQSQIVARRFSRRRQDLDLDFFTRRIRQAIEFRQRSGIDEASAGWCGASPTASPA